MAISLLAETEVLLLLLNLGDSLDLQSSTATNVFFFRMEIQL